MQASPCIFIKKDTLVQVFSCKFCKISKKTFLKNTFERILLETLVNYTYSQWNIAVKGNSLCLKNLNTEIFLIVFYGNFLILRNEPLFSMCKFCTPCFQWLNISFRLESFALTYLLLIRSGEGRVCVWDELKNYTPVFLKRKFFPMSIVKYLKWSLYAKIDKDIQQLFWIHFWLASFF